MSNGTRKKVVDFKKLLVNEEENSIIRKKGSKQNYSNQNNSHKKDKSSKSISKQKENQSKRDERGPSKKQKSRNRPKKEQISVSEMTNKLSEFQEELAFLNKKRGADINIEKIISYQDNNQIKPVNALSNDNKNKNSKNKKVENNKNKNLNSQNDDPNQNLVQNNPKTEEENQNSTLIIDYYKLFYSLFESNRLDNSKPYKFVDYLITGDNLLFNLKKDKSRFEEIKKGMTLKPKNNIPLSEQLLNKSIYEYLRCDFSNSFMKKLTERVNVFLMNRYINKRKGKNSLENSVSVEKKDKFTYSNFLADKLKENTNKSCLSFTNDIEYFKSLIYVCNKYSKFIGKKEIPEKVLIESLEKNKNILEGFKREGEEPFETSRKIESEYLSDLLHNKSIRKYTTKKLKSLNTEILENNKMLNSLDIDKFYKIMNIIIKNKNDDDVDKLYKIFDEEQLLIDKEDKIGKSELKNFVIIFRFLLDLELTNNLNNKEANNFDQNKLNNISILKEMYEYINLIQINNSQALIKVENVTMSNGSQKKGRSRIRAKKEQKEQKEQKEKENEENVDNVNIINKNIEDENNKNNIDINSNNENNININVNNNNNNNNIKPKRKSAKNSKIIQFKIPYSTNNINSNINNNSNANTNANASVNVTANININPNNNTSLNSINKTNNSLFEINTVKNDTPNSNQNYKMDEANKNNSAEKTYFEIQNDKNEAKNEKENHKSRSRRRRKNAEDKDKDKNDNHSKSNNKENNNENTEKDIKKEGDYDSLNNSITFSHINQSTIKELNISKYILDRLSSGQDIFKLIIEKPKKKNKEKETDKEKDKENDKEKEKEKDKDIGNEIINIKENDKENENNIVKPKRRGRSRKPKKDEDIKMKKEEIKEDSEEDIKITKEDIHIIEEKEEEAKQGKEVIILDRDNKEEMKHEKEEKEKGNMLEFKLIKKESNNKDNKDNKDINIKKEIEIKEESLKSMEKNVKPINNYMHIEKKNEKGRNIDIINFNNNMTQEGETIKEITRNDLKHSPNIGVKISQKIIKIPTYKNNELIFNVNNSPSKFLFATNKNSNLETKTKIKKSENNKRDSFKNINIQIDRQSVEIKGGNLILNDKRDNQNEENIKIKEYFHIIEQK